MRLFPRRSRRSGAAKGRGDRRADRREAEQAIVAWMNQRRGVEVYVEPRTSVTGNSMLLVAHDGEFTRRPVASPEAARDFANRHELPVYDAMVVGYPQRMRDWSRRRRIEQRGRRFDGPPAQR